MTTNGPQQSDNRIDRRFRELRGSGQKALVPFVTIGFPDVETSLALADAILQAGADMLELGIPFSDPLADGPTIQRTSYQALKQGVNLRTCLDVLRRLRARRSDAPLVFMGYFNPFLRYGLERFVAEAASAGLDGTIVPDLPPEESGPFQRLCQQHGIYLIPLLAPTSTDYRIAMACKEARGFIYCVSLTGVTGARQQLATGLSDLVSRIRRHTSLPVLVGIGISRPEHVRAASAFADGAVVGSALLDAVDRAPREQAVDTAREFVKALKAATEMAG